MRRTNRLHPVVALLFFLVFQKVLWPQAPGALPKPRIALFQAAGFPAADAPAPDAAALSSALAGYSVDTIAASGELSRVLTASRYDLLLLPYGSSFPAQAWPEIKTFLERGGNLLVLGGAPFLQPVLWDGMNQRWVAGTRQPTYAHELLIGPVDELDVSPSGLFAGSLQARVVADSDIAFPSMPLPTRVFALTVRFATSRDFEREDGAAGPREAVLRPLVQLVDSEGIPRACTLLEIDRLRGFGAGGRWVFAPSNAPLSSEMVRVAVARALEGASEINARPFAASIRPGELPAFRVIVRRPKPGLQERPTAEARLTVSADSGRKIVSLRLPLQGPQDIRLADITLERLGSLKPGLYHVEIFISGVAWHPRSFVSGFWVEDRRLLTAAPKLSVSRDWLRRDGKPLPVVGTTYMGSDVHRKFLFEPNPHTWDRDFRLMARLGIRFVRTGLWTGWSRLMLDAGALDENALRALDAFVLCAARHGIEVCFTFFAFLPPSFGGTNPYLDPIALEGQKTLLTAVAQRYRGVNWIHYDLINEPSYAPADALWQNRPVLDIWEKRAWQEWLIKRHGNDLDLLGDLWRDPATDLLSLPGKDDLSYAAARQGRKPRKSFDFTLFSQETVRDWAALMRDTLRASGGDPLVTLGQDEAGTAKSPAQQIYFPAVDYTSVHTWWNNDDLLWDAVVTKVPEKPNLIQETGLMRLEDSDGNPWRTPAAAAALLERKLAYAFAGRGAGAVQWAWNINPFQPLDNEAVIGIFRPDGTAKPELEPLRRYARFFEQAAPYLDDFLPADVALLLPQMRLFSGRPLGLDALKRSLRVLADHFGLVPIGLSDLRLNAERLKGVKLLIAPVPEMLGQEAAAAIVQACRAGMKFLVTGALSGDSYGRRGEALTELAIADAGRYLAQREPTPWAGGWATFDRGQQEFLLRSCAPQMGELKGNIWHEPLPLELAREDEPLRALYGAALAAAGVEVQPSDVPLPLAVLKSERVALAVVVNETAADQVRRIQIGNRILQVMVKAGRSRLLLIERRSGTVLLDSEEMRL